MHSTETATFDEDVRGKRVLLIGGGFSAEDLALQAVKCGASRVFILCRSKYGGDGTYCNHWPGKKVRVYYGYSVNRVCDEGRSVECKALEIKWPISYEENTTKSLLPIRNIDTVIFCTGYHCSTEMIDKSFSKGFPDGSCSKEFNYEMPADWKMKPNNLTSLIGDIKPDVRYVDPSTVNFSYYRGVNISNPNMMILSNFGYENPLLSIDIHAHLLAQYLNGMIKVPSREEMEDEVERQFLHEMQYIHRRNYYDKNYAKAVDALGLWDAFYEGENTALGELGEDYEVLQLSVGKIAKEGNYPLQIINHKGEFTEKGENLILLDDLCDEHRTNMDPENEEKKWMTYRDYTNGDQFQSLYTGTKAQKTLGGKWLEF